jgi:hypothetical protein
VTSDLDAPDGDTVLLDNICFEPVLTSQASREGTLQDGDSAPGELHQ